MPHEAAADLAPRAPLLAASCDVGAGLVLEAEAYRRAMAGSDRLMAFLLKARRPQVYRERVDVRHGGEADAGEAEARERVRRMSREEKERLLAGAGLLDGREQERQQGAAQEFC